MDLDAENVHYLSGNHDYYIIEWYTKFAETYPFHVSKDLRLESGGNKFYFTHGYEMEVLVTMSLI